MCDGQIGNMLSIPNYPTARSTSTNSLSSKDGGKHDDCTLGGSPAPCQSGPRGPAVSHHQRPRSSLRVRQPEDKGSDLQAAWSSSPAPNTSTMEHSRALSMPTSNSHRKSPSQTPIECLLSTIKRTERRRRRGSYERHQSRSERGLLNAPVTVSGVTAGSPLRGAPEKASCRTMGETRATPGYRPRFEVQPTDWLRRQAIIRSHAVKNQANKILFLAYCGLTPAADAESTRRRSTHSSDHALDIQRVQEYTRIHPVSKLDLAPVDRYRGTYITRAAASAAKRSKTSTKMSEESWKIARKDKQRNACPEIGCAFTAPYPSGLRRHAITHEGKDKLPCPVMGCATLLKNEDSLAGHLRKLHKRATNTRSSRLASPTPRRGVSPHTTPPGPRRMVVAPSARRSSPTAARVRIHTTRGISTRNERAAALSPRSQVELLARDVVTATSSLSAMPMPSDFMTSPPSSPRADRWETRGLAESSPGSDSESWGKRTCASPRSKYDPMPPLEGQYSPALEGQYSPIIGADFIATEGNAADASPFPKTIQDAAAEHTDSASLLDLRLASAGHQYYREMDGTSSDGEVSPASSVFSDDEPELAPMSTEEEDDFPAVLEGVDETEAPRDEIRAAPNLAVDARTQTRRLQFGPTQLPQKSSTAVTLAMRAGATNALPPPLPFGTQALDSILGAGPMFTYHPDARRPAVEAPPPPGRDAEGNIVVFPGLGWQGVCDVTPCPGCRRCIVRTIVCFADGMQKAYSSLRKHLHNRACARRSAILFPERMEYILDAAEAERKVFMYHTAIWNHRERIRVALPRVRTEFGWDDVALRRLVQYSLPPLGAWDERNPLQYQGDAPLG